MKVTEKTPYNAAFQAAEKYFTQAGKERLTAGAKRLYGDYWDLTLGEFFGMAQNELPERLGDLREGLVLQKYWLEGFAVFADVFAAALKKVTPPQGAKEMQASEACMKMTMQEGMLVFARSYFGLPSFAAAEKVTLADYLIAKKDSYNTYVYNRRLAALNTPKK